MTTTDDIFWIYERNSYIYSVCEETKNDKTCKNDYHEDSNCKECFCHSEAIVHPIMIGYIWTPCRMNKKSYIKIGEECPICMEPIIHKKNAYLTCCGHSFHRKCILKLNETNGLNDFTQLTCPICRDHQGSYEENNRYGYNTKNGLDKLEEFSINKDYQSCEICDFSDLKSGKNHYVGMNKNCHRCQTYRQTGRK